MNLRREIPSAPAIRDHVSSIREVKMIVVQMKCQMCGERFEAKLLDRDDPKERSIIGSPVRCPRCNSERVETVRRVRRAS